MDRRIINPWTWQDSYGYVQANEVRGAERTLYCAGLGPVDDDGNLQHEDDMRAQLGLALDNLETLLGEAGMSLADVVRLNWYTTDIDAFWGGYESAARRLAEAGCRPASTLLGISRLARPGMMIEIEATAVR